MTLQTLIQDAAGSINDSKVRDVLHVLLSAQNTVIEDSLKRELYEVLRYPNKGANDRYDMREKEWMKRSSKLFLL